MRHCRFLSGDYKLILVNSFKPLAKHRFENSRLFNTSTRLFHFCSSCKFESWKFSQHIICQLDLCASVCLPSVGVASVCWRLRPFSWHKNLNWVLLDARLLTFPERSIGCVCSVSALQMYLFPVSSLSSPIAQCFLNFLESFFLISLAQKHFPACYGERTYRRQPRAAPSSHPRWAAPNSSRSWKTTSGKYHEFDFG